MYHGGKSTGVGDLSSFHDIATNGSVTVDISSPLQVLQFLFLYNEGDWTGSSLECHTVLKFCHLIICHLDFCEAVDMFSHDNLVDQEKYGLTFL